MDGSLSLFCCGQEAACLEHLGQWDEESKECVGSRVAGRMAMLRSLLRLKSAMLGTGSTGLRTSGARRIDRLQDRRSTRGWKGLPTGLHSTSGMDTWE